MADSFYVGYVDRAPDGVRRTMRRLIPVLLALVIIPASLLVQGQKFDESVFEFGDVKEFEGVYHDSPVPYLLTDSGDPLLLVGRAKYAVRMEARSGSRIQISGTRIIRDGTVMVEMVPDSETLLAGPAVTATATPHRVRTLSVEGEVVEAKCYLGVMNPGAGPAHRACARLCLAGGVPAMLHFTDRQPDDGHEANSGILVTGLSQEVLSRFAAQKVVVSGTEWAAGNLRWIEVDDVRLAGPEGQSPGGVAAS